MTLRSPRLFAVLAAALIAAGLSGCGRRGPLELPPETQARGALRAEARRESGPHGAQAAAGDASRVPPPPIPGTIGNRPPAQYPFPLDPLL